VALLATHGTAGLHVLHVFHDGPTVTRVVYWGPESGLKPSCRSRLGGGGVSPEESLVGWV
jgi:hypothetical protein